MKEKIKIVVDNKIPFLRGVLEPYANVDYYPVKEITKEKIFDADGIIIRTRTKCNESLLKGTKVKLITTATIGFDHIDTEYCNKHNIKWFNAPGCNSTSVMQYITSALLEIAQSEKFSLSEKTIGIVGVGNVGSKIKKVAEIFGMKVLLNDPPRERKEKGTEFCNLNRVLAESDIITMHVPLNKKGLDKTYHLVDEKFFNQMEKKPIFINSSRGEVVKTSALKKAINSGIVSKTVIDVWEDEPNIDLDLLDMVEISSPHIAGYSADGKANGTAVCVNAINHFFNLEKNANWYPENIPFPKDGIEIFIDGKEKSDQEIITEAVFGTYSIMEDSFMLKKSPQTFEKQRGDYPVRREFSNFNLNLKHCNPIVVEKLVKLNFNIK